MRGGKLNKEGREKLTRGHSDREELNDLKLIKGAGGVE